MSSNIPFYYLCRTCLSRGKAQSTPICTKFKIPINPEEDFCSFHSAEDGIICALCGSTEHLIIYEFGDKYLITCASCSQAIGTCKTCENIQTCDFANDHSEPQVVMKTIHRGMMTMQSQVKNPNLVNRHCLHCSCGSPEGSCGRDDNGVSCQNWQVQTALLQ